MIQVFTNGCFDGLHPGHLFLLGYCRALGDKLIVGINAQDYIISHKRSTPHRTQGERIADLKNLGIIDQILIFDNDPTEIIKSVQPNIYCLGEEYKDNYLAKNVCQELNIEVNFVPRVGTWSSSKMFYPAKR